MRKIMSLILAAMLLVSCCSFSLAETAADGEDEAIEFDASITNAINETAATWFSAEETRGLATILLALDFTLAVGDDSELFPDMSEPTYIGKDGVDLAVYMHAGPRDIIIVYRPATGEAVYMETDVNSALVIKAAMEAICSDGYYENDIETMYSIAQELSEILDSDD